MSWTNINWTFVKKASETPFSEPRSLSRAAMALSAAVFVLSLGWSHSAQALVPVTMTVHGVLSSAGVPSPDGTYNVTFALYDTKLGGKSIWKEGPLTVVVSGGQFIHPLGAASPLDAGLLAALKEAWLGVTVAQDPELPRRPLRSVAYALVAQRAASLSCSGCVSAAQLAPGAVKAGNLSQGAVGASNVSFTYAGSKTKGGAALSALDLKCTGCVSISEIKGDGDLNLGGNVLKAGKVVAGSLAASTVAANSFVGDGSKLTGIKTAAGSCSKAGEVVKGIKPDGSLDCVAAMGASSLPADGLDDVSNGLLTNQFVDKIKSPNLPIAIPDHNPVGVSDVLNFPNLGLAQKLIVNVELENSDISALTINLYDPNNVLYVLYDKGGKGTKIVGSWPSKNKPVSGDLTTWEGKNPQGKWRLKVIDHAMLNNTIDGKVVSWSVEIHTLSNQKVAAKGMLRTPGGFVIKSANKAPVKCSPDFVGYLYYDPDHRVLSVCNGLEFDVVETLPGGLGSKGKPALSCQEILSKDKGAKDGRYWIDPDGAGGPGGKYQVWCNMSTAGGGWVLVMQVQAGHSTAFGYGSSYWTSSNVTTSVPPQALSSVNAKYPTFNSYSTVKGELMLRDKSSLNHSVLSVPGMKGHTLLDRFLNLGGKKAYNLHQGAALSWVAGKASPQELMGFSAPSAMCSQFKVKWRMNMLSSHSGVRIGNDVATNKQTTNNPSDWVCYDYKTNLSYSGLGGTLENARQWQDSYGSEALNRYRSNGGTGQGSQGGLELYVR